ncbi:hypothetical protein KEM55_009034, partial [Ascosphaera atra]
MCRTPRYAPLAGTSTPSGMATPSKARATTLDIPGLTRSKVSPDGHISSRDVGSKLVIIMVGLPARGKSYITKKLARYLNWLQHDTRIFNVGERRRVATGGQSPSPTPAKEKKSDKAEEDLRESIADLNLNDHKKQSQSPPSPKTDTNPARGRTEATAPAVPNDDTSQGEFPGKLQPFEHRRRSTQILVNGRPIDNLSEDFRNLDRDPSPMTDAENTPKDGKKDKDTTHLESAIAEDPEEEEHQQRTTD